MSKEGKKKKKGRVHPILMITSICVLVFAVLAVAFDQFQMYRFEQGLLDVCAAQQDAYVQLVLDQININQNRDVEDIIDILETMDGSTNKYWTFSREQSMLFVKDVLETNRYQGFTTGTYYISDSARDFLDGLQLNRVIHKNIELQGKEYIASGVSFAYRGETYRLCLLTNKSVMLDNNKFLGARTELNILFICLTLLLVCVPMLFASKVRKLQRERDEQGDVIVELNGKLTELNKLLSEQDIRDTRHNVWSGDALEDFAEKLRERGLVPSTIIKVRCSDGEVSQELLRKAGTALDRSVLRFLTSEEKGEFVSFLFVGSDYETAMSNLEILLNEKIEVKETRCLTKDRRWDSLQLSPEEMKAMEKLEKKIPETTNSLPAANQSSEKEPVPEKVKAQEKQAPATKSVPAADPRPNKEPVPKEVKVQEKQLPATKSVPAVDQRPDKKPLPKEVKAQQNPEIKNLADSLKSRQRKEIKAGDQGYLEIGRLMKALMGGKPKNHH